LGIAGPVRDGRCEATNLPWVVDSQKIAVEFNIPRVSLINDLEANAYGIGALEAKDFEILNQGIPGSQGNRAVISAGTGLGEAVLYWTAGRTGQSHPRGGMPILLQKSP